MLPQPKKKRGSASISVYHSDTHAHRRDHHSIRAHRRGHHNIRAPPHGGDRNRHHNPRNRRGNRHRKSKSLHSAAWSLPLLHPSARFRC